MKHRSARILALTLAFAPVVSLRAQPAASPASADSVPNGKEGSFTITWTRSTPPDLRGLRTQFKLLEKEVEKGSVPNEQLGAIYELIQETERRAPPLITVRTKGGPLRDFIATAAKLEGISLTLINAADASDLDSPVSAFELRDANWGTVINVLSTLLASRDLRLRIVGSDHQNPSEARSVVCVLDYTDAARSARDRTSQSEFEPLQLGEHLFPGQTIDTVVDAIRVAWELDPKHDPAALLLKFHPATKLLLASGPAPAGSIAKQVVANLQKKPAQR